MEQQNWPTCRPSNNIPAKLEKAYKKSWICKWKWIDAYTGKLMQVNKDTTHVKLSDT
jgi:hypothetical protein